MKKEELKFEKSESIYRCCLDLSEYDYLEVTQDEYGRITAKFLDVRWRTVKETQKLFREIADTLDSLPETTKRSETSSLKGNY